jgi:hypothetical protein
MDFKKLFYTLDHNGDPKESSMWDACFLLDDMNRRQVGKTWIGHVKVSTVFLTINHNLSGMGYDPDGWEDRTPILFETMIFGGRYNECQWRYATRAEALKGHWRAVRLATSVFLWDVLWNRVTAPVIVAALLVALASRAPQINPNPARGYGTHSMRDGSAGARPHPPGPAARQP